MIDRTALLLSIFCLSSGCVAMRNTGTLPSFPSDADLANDGSDGAVKELMARYEIRDQGLDVKIGKAVRARGGRIWPNKGNLHPHILGYLENDPVSRGVLPGSGTRVAATLLGGLGVLCALTLVGALIGIPILVGSLLLTLSIESSEAEAIVAYNRQLRKRIKENRRESSTPASPGTFTLPTAPGAPPSAPVPFVLPSAPR